MVAAPVAPLPSGTVAAEVEEKKATRRRQGEATTTTTAMKSVDRESIPSTTMPPPPSLPSSSSSSLVPNQRVRVRGVPATVRYVGPVANKDPADTWIGLEWDDDAASSTSSSSSSEGRRCKHDGSVGGVRYFQTRARRKGPAAPMMTGSLVRAAALDAPGVLVVGCSVEEALVRRYRGSCVVDNEKSENGNGGDAAAAAGPSPPAPLPSSSSSSSFVAGHEEVAARLARIHELEVASVTGSPAAFCLEEEEDRGDGGGERKGDDERGAAAAAKKESPLLAPLGELAPSLRALEAAGCLFSEWREIEQILRALPGLERLDLTRCGGLATAEDFAVVVEEEEKDSSSSSSSISLPPPPPNAPRLPAAVPLRGLRELVLAETGTEWASVLSALAGSGVRGLRALSLRRCGLRCLGGGGDNGGGNGDGGNGGSGPAGRSKKLLPASSVLSRLEELDLSENDLSCWWAGDEEGEVGRRTGIADELGELACLSTLDLSRNPRLASLSSSFYSLRPHSPSEESSSSPTSFAALKELRLAECGLSSWAELDCLFEEEKGGEEERSGEEQKATAAAAAAAAKNSVPPFPRLSSLRLSGNPLPAPDPTTGCARADVVARLRGTISSLNGAKVGVRERADAGRALEAARRRTRRLGGAGGGEDGGASLAGLSLGDSSTSCSLPPPPSTHSSSASGIMAPMAASMLELRIVLSTEEQEEEPLPQSSSSSASAKKARPPVRLPGSTTVTRLRQLAARLTGVPAREQVLRVEMGTSGEEERGGGGGEEGGGCAAADDDDGDSSVVLLELTPADDSRDLRFLGVSSSSVVRVSRR